QIFAETAVGVVAAERLADADRVIAELKGQLAEARAARPEVDPASVVPLDQHREVADQLTTLTARAEKAEKELASAQIRAQGAERNLTHASAQAAKAEAHATALEGQAA